MSNLRTKNARILQTLKVHTSDVTSMEFWGNTLLATGSSDKTVRIWKWTVGEGFVEEDFSPLLGHKYGVTCVRISPQVSICYSFIF
ncbi:unnamed protein product [Hermetia illucens]|uniref:Uncharacterized protein n=1 Tax=Hermetia illucens TaxID=343691 RepID=A0A7R8YLC0_HERIL|nr:unnamed protein product [Hermetia illucens]